MRTGGASWATHTIRVLLAALDEVTGTASGAPGPAAVRHPSTERDHSPGVRYDDPRERLLHAVVHRAFGVPNSHPGVTVATAGRDAGAIVLPSAWVRWVSGPRWGLDLRVGAAVPAKDVAVSPLARQVWRHRASTTFEAALAAVRSAHLPAAASPGAPSAQGAAAA